MSEDQDLLARIGQLAGMINKACLIRMRTDCGAGHINLHKAQSPSSQTTTHEQTNTRSSGPSVARGTTAWRPPRPAPYQIAQGRGRGAYRPYGRNRSLVVNNVASPTQVPQTTDLSAITTTTGSAQSGAAYVTTNGRHRQYINASILPKVTEQRKRAIEESQHRKALANDRWERQRMHQYLVGLDAKHPPMVTPGSSKASSGAHEVQIDGLNFRVLKGGSKLSRVYGETIFPRSSSAGA